MNLKRNPTGELQVFKEIWIDRGQWSEVSNTPITSPHPWNFAHILPKGKYPHFRLKKENIMIMTKDEHYEWDNNRESLRDDPMWQKVFAVEEKLIKEYAMIKAHFVLYL